MGDAGYNRIANAAGQFSVMMWTCDEFPFATYETPYQNPYHKSETETFASAVLLKEAPDNTLSTLREAILYKPILLIIKVTIKGI
ncbi:Uncharacterized protein HZ326_25371 [Fusarium oxysporum f. sp. albedinis]|nr:Uncharacterized protein HZ326_25371 [Fusarium oxysporum f. sp. albedinis]